MLLASSALRLAIAKLKLGGWRQYEIAQAVGYTHPSQLSHVLAGAVFVGRRDPRIERLCSLAGLSFDEAFIDRRPTINAIELYAVRNNLKDQT